MRKLSVGDDTIVLTTKITKGLDERVRKFCDDAGCNRSQGVRELLERGLVGRPAKAPRARRNGTKTECPSNHSIARRLGDMCMDCGETVK